MLFATLCRYCVRTLGWWRQRSLAWKRRRWRRREAKPPTPCGTLALWILSLEIVLSSRVHCWVWQASGHVGLRNQGATCYLSSIIQCLYHNALFRRMLIQNARSLVADSDSSSNSSSSDSSSSDSSNNDADGVAAQKEILPLPMGPKSLLGGSLSQDSDIARALVTLFGRMQREPVSNPPTRPLTLWPAGRLTASRCSPYPLALVANLTALALAGYYIPPSLSSTSMLSPPPSVSPSQMSVDTTVLTKAFGWQVISIQ